MINYSFYNVNIDTPLSLALGSSGREWENSILGQLGSKTKGQVHLKEIPINSHRSEYCWRVVDAYFSQEDDVMTYFRAYNLDGSLLGDATFGVNYGTVKSRIKGNFRYRPAFGNQYYVPAQNNFMTPNTGGYTVEVLDRNSPSEGLAFGMYKQGNQHQCLTISFRLFRLDTGYPNDLNLVTR